MKKVTEFFSLTGKMAAYLGIALLSVAVITLYVHALWNTVTFTWNLW